MSSSNTNSRHPNVGSGHGNTPCSNGDVISRHVNTSAVDPRPHPIDTYTNPTVANRVPRYPNFYPTYFHTNREHTHSRPPANSD
jgi:hypothetical protein